MTDTTCPARFRLNHLNSEVHLLAFYHIDSETDAPITLPAMSIHSKTKSNIIHHTVVFISYICTDLATLQ